MFCVRCVAGMGNNVQRYRVHSSSWSWSSVCLLLFLSSEYRLNIPKIWICVLSPTVSKWCVCVCVCNCLLPQSVSDPPPLPCSFEAVSRTLRGGCCHECIRAQPRCYLRCPLCVASDLIRSAESLSRRRIHFHSRVYSSILWNSGTNQ